MDREIASFRVVLTLQEREPLTMADVECTNSSDTVEARDERWRKIREFDEAYYAHLNAKRHFDHATARLNALKSEGV